MPLDMVHCMQYGMHMTSALNTPEWIRSHRRAHGLCEQCGTGPQDTQWAGTSELICWTCCTTRQDDYAARCQPANRAGKLGARIARIIGKLVIVLSVAATTTMLVLSALVVTHTAHIDAYPQIRTYGISVGSDTHYCYADLVGWHLSAGCETAN